MIIVSPVIRTGMKICSGILFFLTLFSAYGGHISPHVWATPSIFTLGFPYMALLTLIVSIAWIIGRRWVTGGIGIVTLILCSGPLFTVCPLGHKRTPSPVDTPRFSVMSYNILHGDDVEKHDSTINRTIQYIIDSGADIVALQELYNFSNKEVKILPKNTRDSLFTLYPYRVTDGYNDLCLLSKYPARLLKVNDMPYGSDYFYEAYRINIDGRKLTLLNVHLASYQLSEGERDFVDKMKSLTGAKSSIKEFKGTIFSKLKQAFINRSMHAQEIRQVIDKIKGPLIVCGDFNDVPASWTYYKVKGDDLKDAFTETHFGPIYTYNLHHFYFHIDQMFYRGDLMALSTGRGKIRSSDHYPKLGEFAFIPER
ncbi:MAG: endonuclease/exonuclease/phosphatase family protein [Prevotella sp.]|nr:endonuclease/exonuclease/phosphatase family protein [Prevotella sp.]MCM1437409.1 endonuclease/exonuclease/phosphatase family protein [Prevotella sp.]